MSKQLDWVLILTLTKEYSQDEVSNANGEELGWLRKFQLTPQFRTAMTDLKVGATTKPIKLPYDLQVIRLLEHKSAGMVSMYEARATIVKSLRASSNQIHQAYLEGLTKENPILIWDEASAHLTGSPNC